MDRLARTRTGDRVRSPFMFGIIHSAGTVEVSSVITLTNAAVVVDATTITITATSTGDLSTAAYGVEYSIGVGVPIENGFAQSVSGQPINQSITLNIAAIGAVPGDTVNLRCYYNADVLDPPGTRVRDGEFVIVLSAPFIGLEASPDYILQETGDKILVEAGAVDLDISAMPAAAALDGTEQWLIVQGGVTIQATTNQLRTYING